MGRGLAQSTFHHFADYNWDPRDGSPSFVDEPPGRGMIDDPETLRQTQRYMRKYCGLADAALTERRWTGIVGR